MLKQRIVGMGILTLTACACGGPGVDRSGERPPDERLADVIYTQTSSMPGGYQFAVHVSSPDTGCERYANWWEVIGEDGTLFYRRVLNHSHVDDQPIVRAGGPVVVDPDATIFVRAHMHPGGYGGKAMKGSVNAGFEPVELPADFAAGLATEPPQPERCKR